jgi:hypothetical protein
VTVEPNWASPDEIPPFADADVPELVHIEDIAVRAGQNGTAPLEAPGSKPSWLLDAADLLAEPDPGPTPMLVEGLIVERAIVAMVGRWKTTKSYGLLYLLMCVALGEPAWGLPTTGGPVVYVCEESGRAALWRRLDALCRGYGFDPEHLRERLYVAANNRVRLDDAGWQAELLAIGHEIQPLTFGFDPLARMKSPAREENAQTDMAVVIEYLRELRDETQAGVGFVHHTGHTGGHMRGSSDLESVWETRLTWTREGESPDIEVKSDHRDAEGITLKYRIAWDHDTRTMRFPLVEGDVKVRARDYLKQHPEASANDVVDALGTNRKQTLAAVKEIRAEGGSEVGNHPGTTPSETPSRCGSPATPFRGAGTTSAESSSEGGSERGNYRLEDEVERLARKAEEWGA